MTLAACFAIQPMVRALIFLQSRGPEAMSVAHLKPIVGIHKNDPEWIIALWLAIHGGDPAPELSTRQVHEAAAGAIKALATRLEPGKHKAVVAALSH